LPAIPATQFLEMGKIIVKDSPGKKLETSISTKYWVLWNISAIYVGGIGKRIVV
jgi:hypothetical protein